MQPQALHHWRSLHVGHKCKQLSAIQVIVTPVQQSLTSSWSRLPSSSGKLASKLPDTCNFCRFVSLLIAGGSSVMRFPASVSSCGVCEGSRLIMRGEFMFAALCDKYLQACYVEDLLRYFL